MFKKMSYMFAYYDISPGSLTVCYGVFEGA